MKLQIDNIEIQKNNMMNPMMGMNNTVGEQLLNLSTQMLNVGIQAFNEGINMMIGNIDGFYSQNK